MFDGMLGAVLLYFLPSVLIVAGVIILIHLPAVIFGLIMQWLGKW